MSLITDYRPEDFDDFIGSEAVIESLQTKLKDENRPRTYLFTGGSGCGKTTLARILGRKLGALDVRHFIEKNTSDFRGIGMIRNLKPIVTSIPSGKNKARVWLFDECHQITKDAQEAMLKLLEDANSTSYFILCTTDPQNLKTTLIRRCCQFSLQNLDDDDIITYLNEVIESEEKQVPESIIEHIAENSDGSIGKALALLEEVIDSPKSKMLEVLKNKESELNEAIDLCRALMKGLSWKDVSSILKGIKENKLQPESIRHAVLGYCSTILLKGKNDTAYLIMDCFRGPFYDAPMAQLTMACYDVIEGE